MKTKQQKSSAYLVIRVDKDVYSEILTAVHDLERKYQSRASMNEALRHLLGLDAEDEEGG